MTLVTLQPSLSSRPRARESAERRGAVARVVLLGASNLTRGIASAVDSARAALGGPLEVYAAMGLGRSYGLRTRFLGRTLPGILESGLWDALRTAVERGPELPLHALMTDLGNDIIYEVDPARFCGWIEECADRLQARGARRIAITQLPLPTIDRLSPAAYFVVRSVLFPFRTISLGKVREAAARINGRVLELAGERRIHAPGHEAHWYGLDPAHYLAQHRAAVWRQFMESWREERPEDGEFGDAGPGRPVKAPGRTFFGLPTSRLRWSRAASWSFLGVPLRGRQPAARLADGTTLSVF